MYDDSDNEITVANEVGIYEDYKDYFTNDGKNLVINEDKMDESIWLKYACTGTQVDYKQHTNLIVLGKCRWK